MSTPAGPPIPAVTPALAPFFAAARRHELVVQRCGGCGALRFPAREVCSRCLSRQADWVPVSGRGRVWSFVVMHQAAHPWFGARVPYAVVQVELDEGVRMISNLRDVPASEVRIGQGVEVVFDAVAEDVVLPCFRPRAG
ncbi:MAG: OB-fold domain-containing protein [bacterium]|nr:OB-fold domain-containing protein [bacterium]